MQNISLYYYKIIEYVKKRNRTFIINVEKESLSLLNIL